MEIRHKERTIILKVVYYGPALCGKTTNLKQSFDRLKPEQKLSAEILEIPTEVDKTLRYDFMPLTIGKIAGYKAKFMVYTVPGQVHYEASRKLILKNVDGIVFVADSQKGMGDENLLSLMELTDHLKEQKKRLYDDVSLVLQFNKQDVPDAMPVEMMAQSLQQRDDTPWFAACALDGTGVMETFQTIVKMTVANIKMAQNTVIT